MLMHTFKNCLFVYYGPVRLMYAKLCRVSDKVICMPISQITAFVGVLYVWSNPSAPQGETGSWEFLTNCKVLCWGDALW